VHYERDCIRHYSNDYNHSLVRLRHMVRDVYIDADHILHNVTNSKTYDTGFEEQEGSYEDFGSSKVKLDLKPYKKHFEAIIEDYITTAEVESICYDWELGDVHVVLSSNNNFRFEVFPEYKCKRPKDKPKLFSKLQKWARKKYRVEPRTEADDVVSYYVRKGAVGFTTDKDMFKGVAGKWYNCHYMHKNWLTTTPKEAENFFKCQLLAGDNVDDIPSLAGVGLITAQKLMKQHGDSYTDIENIFKLKGHDKAYMLQMGRLVSMSQWTPTHGIRLWKGKKL